MTDRDDGSKPDCDLPVDDKAGAVEVAKNGDGKETVGEKDGAPVMGPQTGWAPQFGWPTDSIMEGESLLDHQTWLEGKIPDKFYGGQSRTMRVLHAHSLSSSFANYMGFQIGITMLQ